MLAAVERAPANPVRALLDADAGEVQASLFAVILQIALADALTAAELVPARTDANPLGSWLEGARDWLRSAGLRSGLLFGRRSPLDDPRAIEQWLGGAHVATLVNALASGAPHVDRARIGAVYEELLAFRVCRLDGDSLPLGPSSAWVSVRSLLKEAPTIRSKWLQRTLGLPKSTVQRLASALSHASTEGEMLTALAPLSAREKSPLPGGTLVIDASFHRRRSGSHYTPDALATKVVERVLGPLVEGASSARLRSLRICDPAMGSGAFLEQAAKQLASLLASAWRRERATISDGDSLEQTALRVVVSECLFGVDKDPVAADLARACLAALAATRGSSPPDLSSHLRSGDGLVGRVGPGHAEDERTAGRLERFDWDAEFPDVFSGGSPGFDACIGNPPWVAYVGRAAQPLDPAVARYYEAHNPAFRSYRTLHGLFVRRAAELLRPGGRLGLVLPTSVGDLAGYSPTRQAHDELCAVDSDLFDFGDGAFAGVFQPCMALTSTRRPAPLPESAGRGSRSGSVWPLGRSDLDGPAARLLERLDTLPKLAADLFGERGFQSTGDDLAHLRKLDAAREPFVVPIREGGDIGEFSTSPPRTFLAPTGLRGRFRDAEEWRAVRVLIRQTARYPIASLSDGLAFRNSILAGFSNDVWTAAALSAYLNSSAVRWYHFTRHRDARQGMPQLKIGHLRALPDVGGAQARRELDALGATLGARNAGITVAERAILEEIVENALGLEDAERALVAKWAKETPPPVRRKGTPIG